MADLSGSGRSDRRRGQILLIAAFALAVIFVALALVINSAIFTENLASRGEVAGSSEALHYQHQVRGSVGEAIGFANVYNASSTGTLRTSLRESVSDYGTGGGRHQARAGQVLNVSLAGSPAYGVRIADNASGGSTFQNESGAADWRLASGVDRTRNVEVVLHDRSSLSGSATDAVTFEANESGTPGNAWELRLWNDGSNVVVEVETAGGARTERCRIPDASEYAIDVTGGVVNGERCHALTRTGPDGQPMWWGTGLPTGSYEIWVQNGDNVNGNYSMVVDGTPNGDDLAATPTAGTPFHTDAIYQATVEYVFRTPDVVYEADVVVSPGETP